MRTAEIPKDEPGRQLDAFEAINTVCDLAREVGLANKMLESALLGKSSCSLQWMIFATEGHLRRALERIERLKPQKEGDVEGIGGE